MQQYFVCMWLSSLKVENFKSLQSVEIGKLAQKNIFIGRNNCGKSSTLGAIEFLARIAAGRGEAHEGLIHGDQASLRLGISLTFQLTDNERAHLLGLLLNQAEETYLFPHFLKSRFASKLIYQFESQPGQAGYLSVKLVHVSDENGDLIPALVREGTDLSIAPRFRALTNEHFIDLAKSGSLTKKSITAGNFPRLHLHTNWFINLPSQESSWIFYPAGKFLKEAFFFSPFRHSETSQVSKETIQLDQNGQNLAAVLHTLSSNDRDRLERIEDFVKTALPELGRLHAKILNQSTKVVFKGRGAQPEIDLHNMGGGVEQLLLIGTALETSPQDAAFFIEEPESHLHAGAQRLLAERLFNSGRQVFLTSHSSVFLNCGKDSAIFRVAQANGATSVTEIKNQTQLGELLAEIGIRNSDILLSNAVVFVEGSSDEQVLRSWLEKSGINTTEKNISIIQTHGASNISYTGSIRAQILKEISECSPIPHLFIIDRDERSDVELSKISETLGENAAIFKKREIENYLLAPRAIQHVLMQRPQKESNPEPTSTQIEEWIKEGIASNIQTVLLKRIRANVPRLKGGILPRELVLELNPEDPNFVTSLKASISNNIDQHLNAVNFEEVVTQITDKFKTEWQIESNRPDMIPGADVLDFVFKKAGFKFDKCSDAVQIAEAMSPEDIHPEIKALCERIKNLVKPTTA